MKPRKYAKRESAARRLLDQPHPRRGRGAAQRHDKGPPLDPGMLAEVFTSMKTRDLSGAWVAMTVDTLIDLGLLNTPGDTAAMTRALTVVAVRLHGYKPPDDQT